MNHVIPLFTAAAMALSVQAAPAPHPPQAGNSARDYDAIQYTPGGQVRRFKGCTADGYGFFPRMVAMIPIPESDRPGGLPVEKFMDGLEQTFVDNVKNYKIEDFKNGEDDPEAHLAVERALADYVTAFAGQNGVKILWGQVDGYWTKEPTPVCTGVTPAPRSPS